MADDNPFTSPPKPEAPKAAPPKQNGKPLAPKLEAPKVYVPDPNERLPQASAPREPKTGSSRLLIPAFGPLYGFFAPITELLIRLMAGGSLAFHGYQILFGNIEGAGRFFEEVGFSNGLLWAWVVGVLEFGCGILLAIGWLTRLAAGPILVFLLVAIAIYHLENGYNWETRGIEYPLFWAVVVFHFLVRGGGAYSLDRAIGREI